MLSLIPWKTILLHIANKAAGKALEVTRKEWDKLVKKAGELDAEFPKLSRVAKRDALANLLPDVLPDRAKNLIVELVVFYIRIK